MDKNEFLKKLLEKKEIPKEQYAEYDSREPRNMLADAANPILDKYVNPRYQQLVEKVNQYSPVELAENIRIPELSKGESAEQLRDMPENFVTGLTTGVVKAGSPLLQTLKSEVLNSPTTSSKRQAIEAFLESKNLPEEVFDSAEKMKRMMVQRENTERMAEPIFRNTGKNLENLKMTKMLEAQDKVRAARQNKALLDKVAPDLEAIELNKILNPEDATALVPLKKK